MSDSWNCPRKKEKIEWERTQSSNLSNPQKLRSQEADAQIHFNNVPQKKKTILGWQKNNWLFVCLGAKSKVHDMFHLFTAYRATRSKCVSFSFPRSRSVATWLAGRRSQSSCGSNTSRLIISGNKRATAGIKWSLPNHRSWGNATARSLRSLRWQRKARRIDPGWSLEETGTSIQAAAAGPRDDSHLSDCQHSVFLKKEKEKNLLDQIARKSRLHPDTPESPGYLWIDAKHCGSDKLQGSCVNKETRMRLFFKKIGRSKRPSQNVNREFFLFQKK